MTAINHPSNFKEGVRILMRVLRTKDGGKGNVDRHAKKVITRNSTEFDNALVELVNTMQSTERIYSTVDARDSKKAIRLFKQNQLDNDYSKAPEEFYLDIKNRWVSSLQSPRSRMTSNFLWDCDTIEEFEELVRELGTNAGLSSILDVYPTKNGGHIITQPFEYPKLIDPKWHPILHKNAMMLWVY